MFLQLFLHNDLVLLSESIYTVCTVYNIGYHRKQSMFKKESESGFVKEKKPPVPLGLFKCQYLMVAHMLTFFH